MDQTTTARRSAMATKTNDMTKMMQDMMAAMPMDMSAMQDMYKTQAALGEKMMKVALEAAEKSTEIGAKWTKDALHKMGDVAKAKAEPADYSKSMTDFASAAAEMAAEHMAAFAEVAKKMQMETVEIMLAAGKDLSEDATAAVKKAATEATAVAKKATATAAAAAK
ncbi:MAG: Phasin [Gemmobacter sp.]